MFNTRILLHDSLLLTEDGTTNCTSMLQQAKHINTQRYTNIHSEAVNSTYNICIDLFEWRTWNHRIRSTEIWEKEHSPAEIREIEVQF